MQNTETTTIQFGFDARGETTARDGAQALARLRNVSAVEDIRGNWSVTYTATKARDLQPGDFIAPQGVRSLVLSVTTGKNLPGSFTAEERTRVAFRPETHSEGAAVLWLEPLATVELASAENTTHNLGARSAWSARCDCRNGHSSSSGRCNARNVTDTTRTEADGFAACEDCRENCPCGKGTVPAHVAIALAKALPTPTDTPLAAAHTVRNRA